MKITPVILAFFVLIVGCTKSGNQKQNEAPENKSERQIETKSSENLLRIEPEMLRDLRTTTSTVEQHPSGDGVILLGEVTVNEDAYSQVGAPIAARIINLTAFPGQQVHRGQQLAVLQSTELGKVRSENTTAQARLQLARQTLERKLKLAKERIVSQRDVQEAEAAVASAEADSRASKANLQALGTEEDVFDGSQLALRSPIEGTVIERTALRGQMADPAQSLFKIADLRRVWLNVHAFERDAVRLQAGRIAKVTLPALPGRLFQAKVTLIGSQVDLTSRTVSVRVEVANSDRILRPGMSATAWVPLGEAFQQVITVPAAAVQRIENDWYVFIPRSQDTFELRRVGRGRDLEGEIEIIKGLRTGETIVVDGAFLLKAEAEKSRGEGKGHD